jgi:predicted nucleotidyltransferase
MTSGPIIKRIRTEIRSILEGSERIHSIWGFGSFFRQEKFGDIDILVVVSGSGEQLPFDSKTIRANLLTIERRIGIPIDPLVLTATEFQSRPLRDMHELVRIL